MKGAPDTESPLAPPRPPSAPSLSPSDEVHFGLGDDINSSPLTEGGSELQQQQQQKEEEPQATPPSTPTHSNTLSSPMGSDFSARPKEDGGEEVKVKGGRRKRKRGKRASDRRRKPEHGVGSIAPRFMGLSGIHYGLWTQYVSRSPQARAPPLFPPPAMNHHHAWSFAGPGYHHDGFVVPPNSPAHHLWTPMVPATGSVGVPVAS
jgi:hypothetical protein